MLIFEIIRFSGGIYLFYLGIKAILSKTNIKSGDSKKQITQISQVNKNINCYHQGLISTLLNPKAIIFYISIIPQFINPQDDIMVQSIILAALFILITIFWFTLYLFAIRHIHSWFQKPSVELNFIRMMGISLIALGIKLLSE